VPFCVAHVAKTHLIFVKRALSYFEQESHSGDCELLRMARRGQVQTLTLVHTRKVQGVMQMRQTRQMQINEDACIRN